MDAGDYNTLIISDVHLGEDMNPMAHDGTAPSMALVERQLVGFLRHYARVRSDGRAWRLVINGDFVDFMGVSLFPADERATQIVADREISAHEREYGLGRRPATARAKMEAIVDRHEPVFRALGRFLASGNVVDIIAGNHDTEFQWPVVQEAFREGVRRCSRVELTDDRLVDAIRFHDWFFYEPGVLWVEHGHVYDENCSFDYTLVPTGADDTEIATNVDGASMRYVINRNKDAEHGQEDWSLAGYLTWARQLGLRGSLRLAHSYFVFCTRMLAAWRSMRQIDPATDERRAKHNARREQLSAESGVPSRNLEAIDALHKRPVVTNFWRLAGVLMVDKLFIYGSAIAAVLMLYLILPFTYLLLAAGMIFGGAMITARLLNRGRFVDPTVPLLIVPERIIKYVDAPYVVFGHTHDPVNLQLDNGSSYLNTGTWFPTEKPGLLRSFTHVVVRHSDSGSRAVLCQWRDGSSREFVPEAAGVALLAGDSEIALAGEAQLI